jgi:hypothetical protein
MSPSGGLITVVMPLRMWSPAKSSDDDASKKQR